MAAVRPLPPPAPGDLPRGFPSRAALAEQLRQLFPAAEGEPSGIRGGRKAAELALTRLDPSRYRRSRNFLDGAVTGLSPYVRHGVLGLAEFKRLVLGRVRDWNEAEKLISELGWRDFWQRVWLQRGDAIWTELEPLKTGHPPDSYASELPLDLAEGRTGLACIDGFQQQLVGSGWLHNHGRLWLAAYVVHWRRLRWQVGARWFLQHLLDGDPASNNLSWQWVASSFSQKPYIFNRENLERYARDGYCRSCASADSCPFDASYESLQAQLFEPVSAAQDSAGQGEAPVEASAEALTKAATKLKPLAPPQRPMLWIHGEGLGPANPAWAAAAKAPALFVFDRCRIAADGTSLKRLAFCYECLLELPVILRVGDPLEELLAFGERCGADGVIAQRPTDPHLGAIATALAEKLPLLLLEPEAFVTLDSAPQLQRFNRYWRLAEPLLRQQASP